jgi:hypothetical protein
MEKAGFNRDSDVKGDLSLEKLNIKPGGIGDSIATSQGLRLSTANQEALLPVKIENENNDVSVDG